MKQLVDFPGKMTGVFFRNELPYLRSYFGDILVVSYPDEIDECNKIAREFDLEYVIVPKISLRSVFHAFRQYLFDGEVRNEVRGRGVRQRLYVLLYLFWASSAERAIASKGVAFSEETVVYSYWLSRGAFLTSRLANRYKVIRAISRAHRYDLYEEENRFCYLPFRNYIAESLNEIHFISEDGLNYYKDHYPNHKAELFVDRLGTCRASYKKKILDKKIVSIASCSSIISVKRLDITINLLSQLNVPFFWIHIGDGPLRQEIEKLAAANLPQGSFSFLGYVDNGRIQDVYKEYDVDYLVNLSDSEGVPVSIMEAISMGIPAIARDVGGNREILSSDSGLLLSDTDPARFESILKKRFSAEYEDLSEAVFAHWERNYSAERNYSDFVRKISL